MNILHIKSNIPYQWKDILKQCMFMPPKHASHDIITINNNKNQPSKIQLVKMFIDT